MSENRKSIGPWILASVVAICLTVLVLTGHESAAGAGCFLVAAIGLFLFFAYLASFHDR